ncbi:MAG: CYTH domain-containing protein [Deltaproteobacteria bacterium]|nr:CYTH domain-containing protein [Deltaproteobacteria bacterium]
MNIEIERRFLVCGAVWRKQVVDRELLRQGYLAADEKKVIRVRLAGDKGILTIKQTLTGMSRRELEYTIPFRDACFLVAEMSCGYVVEKIRYRVDYAGKFWVVDEFLKENAGLVVAEIELAREEEDFAPPPWLGREVTKEVRFSNAALSRQPFSLWPDRDTITG